MNYPVQSILHIGNEGLIIEIECTITNGLPAVVIVGLGNKSIDEAKERIRSAFSCSKITFPKKRVTINLAPADVPKHSSGFDLPIAVAILLANKQVPFKPSPEEAFVGELGLDGNVRSVRGIIGKLVAGKKQGLTTFYVPQANAVQASLVPGIKVIPLATLNELYLHLSGQKVIDAHAPAQTVHTRHVTAPPHALDEIVGQIQAKRALEIAAAGGHNIFMNGPPGTGKSMLAKALPELLPQMSIEEILEVTHLHSLASNNYEQLVTERPCRSPHHSASQISIVGGGQVLKPGEISLSHRGVLFLDEMPEFSRGTLEALRQPLEDRTITISRAKESALFPADFILVATANPCPCGYYGTAKECRCTAAQISRYKQRISGPILDRIDIHINVDQVNHTSLLRGDADHSQQRIHANVIRARKIQAKRFGNPQRLNATMTNKEASNFSIMSDEAEGTLNQAAQRLDISARSYMKLVKIARTIADIEASKHIELPHICEALQYRSANLRSID